MRIEYEGISLWYGSPDAPAPQDNISAGKQISVTVGVSPADASNKIEIRYQVNQGETQVITAQYVPHKGDRRVQYFRVSLPAFNPGDVVEYTPVCRCAGRQVPPRDGLEGFTSSFVMEAGIERENDEPGLKKDKPTPSKDQITENITNSQSEDIQEPVPSDQSSPSRLSSRKKMRLKNLTLGMAEGKHKAKLEQMFAETEGEFKQLKTRLEESEEFDQESIQRLTFNDDLAEVMEDREDLVAAFVHNDQTNSLREIALNIKKEDLKVLIKSTSNEEEKETIATRLQDRLFRKAPTAVIHRMVRDRELEEEENVCQGLLKFFETNPDLDFQKTSVLNVLKQPEVLKEVAPEDRVKVVNRLKSMQRLSAISPKAEALPKLMKVGLDSAYAINEVPLERFVNLYSEQLGGVDVAKSIHAKAQDISVRNEHSYVALRQAVTGVSVNMIDGGQSVNLRQSLALQIASEKNIPINFETLFGSVDLCECQHCNSVYSPAAYLVELFQYLRNNNLDPENNKTGKDRIKNTPLKKFFRRRPDLGKLQLTCENTNTLIPYIDLVNEVMESFVVNLEDYEDDNHKPKQAKIAVHNVIDESSGELLAEPQHTNYRAYRILKNAVYPVCKLPYHQPIDATRQYLNFLGTSRVELFETFRADIDYKPEENASDTEIERLTRMKELKIQSVDRGIAAEFLHLVEEEYIILTKEGFHTKEWYELDEETSLSQSQYEQKIGLKNTWDYYGIDNENQMLGELKWVKPAQDSGMLGFLRRVNMQYVDLIELLKTRYINPNYLSGKALAYMNSIRYSYRYLQTLVDNKQTDLKAKYQKLVKLLQADLVSDSTNRFDKAYVECWVYKYFAKIGKLIVLEDASSCNCIEGTIRLLVIYKGDDAGSYRDLTINKKCQIYIAKSNPKKFVGHLDTNSGKLILDEAFTDEFSAIADRGEFSGKNGETGQIKDLTLFFRREPFICSNYQESCDISQTQLKHLDGTDLVTSEYDRMHRFIRLWCKLDWTIAEVDQAITGVGETVKNPPKGISNFTASNNFVSFSPKSLPEDQEDEREKNIRFITSNKKQLKPLRTDEDITRSPNTLIKDFAPNPPGIDDDNRLFPRTTVDDFKAKIPDVNPEDCKPEPISQVLQDITPYLIEQLVAVKKLQEITGLELAKLLTYWTSIGTEGENSLYEQLFLKYNLIAVDPVFQEEEFGTYLTQGETFSDHLPVLMSALKASSAMLEKIVAYAGIADELTLENVSHLYRHILLAKSLGIRVEQLPSVLELIKNQAHPFGKPTNTLDFYQLFFRIENSSFNVRELNYIIRNEDDLNRPLRPDIGELFQLAINLRHTLLQIEIDHPDINDDEEATEELLRNKLSLLFDDNFVEQTVGLVQGTTVYEDNTRRKYSTKLSESDRNKITDFLQAERKKEEEEAGGEFQTFLARVQFSNTKGLQVTGILSESDRERLISLADNIENDDDREKFIIVINKILAQPILFFKDTFSSIFVEDAENAQAVLLAEDTIASEGQEDSSIEKRAFLMRAFLPYLREQLRQRQVTQILTSALGLDQDITEKLVMEVIKTDNDEVLYQEIIRLKEQKDSLEEEETLVWQGYFVPEKEGKYTFLLEAEGEATLTFRNQPLWSEPERTDDEQINYYRSQEIFLKAGIAYPFVLQGYDEDETGKIIGLLMKFNDQPQTNISDKVLFPALRTEAFNKAYIKLHKVAILLTSFDMTLEELEFLLEFSDNFAQLDFNTFSFPQWLRLEAFYRLHKSLNTKELSLLEFIRWTHQKEESETEPSIASQISTLTGWELTDVEKLIQPEHFNLSHPQHFRDETNLLKLQATLDIYHKIGVDLCLLFQWGKPTSNFNSNRKISGSIREAIRARYTQTEWEEAIKPVHDQLRENQKQALIAYLLAQPVLLDWGVRDADSLFEFFLIDVQMDACMETSRIKQAISSVQLYVQRCFLGLEAKHGVGSKILDRQRWEWMSRYRVWEANRKVFLYPENWIRPELRDVKSPFFEELESELLQNDVSQDTVKSALTKYIVQVDEVANLEVVGQFIEGEGNARKLHVIGRTRNAPYFFYYRYYEFYDKYWYPWEKIEVDIPSIDIEDDKGSLKDNGTFVMPVVWKDRLFIFFPEFMKKNWNSPLKEKQKIADGAERNKLSDTLPLFYWEIKIAWSERKEGKWTPKQLSKRAINTIVFRDDVGDRYKFDLLLEQDKFIFAPFVKSNSINIQPYYLGRTSKVCEEVFNPDSYQYFKRYIDYPTERRSLNRSFRFDGTQIRIGERTSNTIPDLWGNIYRFHALIQDNSPFLFPIQATNNESNPGNELEPFFWEKDGDSQILASGILNYRFHHPKTKRLLGHLRKDWLNKIFDSFIPLNHNNYGSNDGIQYHELKRPYAIYNWEILFHSVALLADNLSKSQRFEEAMNWWHYIFAPINVKGNIRKVWKFRPFRATDSKNVLQKIFDRLDPNTPDDEITEWREKPFQPHVIARSRPTAYMKWVVMKYIDNLIAWGDSLFRQDTIESINQATQLYILAGHILGPRPEIIPKRGNIQPKSYLDLVDEWDAFSNAMVDLELIFPFSNQIEAPTIPDGEPHYINIYGFATTLYFCIPDNPKLLEYWDTVADRLFKIRHCLNIEGIFRKLNLFEPPIDPALLVQAAAQGLSIGSVLNDLSTPMPNYRFNYLLARALEVTSEVKSLGSALLSALEKKDGESLSLLRSRHDTNIQTLMMEVRNKQLEEAEKSLDSLEQNRKAPEYRLQHYQQLIDEEVSVPAVDAEFTEVENQIEVKDEGGLKLLPPEAEEMKKAKLSADLQTAVGAVEALAGILSLIPNNQFNFQPFGVGASIIWGGQDLNNATRAIARGLQIGVNRTSFQSSAASRKAGYTRQHQDRIFQANLAGHELMQIDKQITAQKIRKEIAQLEIDNHQVQIDQTKEVEEFIRTKFSNEQLYQWMSDQIRDLYYQAYSFAYDLAKKAEKVYRFEMGLSTSDFVKFGYWNSAKEGFLAGEQLYLALKQLENAYIEAKPHDYEITKHISLQQLNPLALIQLKEEGVCEFNLPEEIFDLDYSGHYKRRIKTVSVSIPCVVGPYTSLNSTLRLLKHEYRNSKIATNYPKKLDEADERFITNPIPITAIAVSQGQNDSGTFELNFRDERYLPFEGAGAISSWRLELPQEFHQFDYQTITDVVIHLRYTACEGGTTLKTAAIENLNEYVKNASELSKREGLFRMFSLKHEFPSEWYRFLNPQPETESQILILGNLRERLPFFANSQKVSNVTIQSIMLFVPPIDNELTVSLLRFDRAENVDVENTDPTITLGTGANIGQLKQYTATDLEENINGFWVLSVNESESITADVLSDAWLVIKYQLKG
ncbi:neuraminidase-like domain-containing protein [Dapis sp. BLCC M126]|uniref:Tc toxin subunit A-related protein n=1 Tax=Dapis sp. BLCC M126 TaxID=3400189 RepID=UPI003CEBF796